MTPQHPDPFSRRDFLVASGALVVGAVGELGASRVLGQGAGQAIGSGIARGPAAATAADAAALIPSPEQLDSWIALLPDGTAEAFFGKTDMGQGLEVAIAQIVADELDMAVGQITVRMGDTATTCDQGGASGSTGVSLGARPLRNAAAEARRILLEEAASVLQAPAAELSVTSGVITAAHLSTQRVTYAELVARRHFDAPLEWNKAVGNFMDVKGRARPKSPSEYRLVGQSVPRRDVPGKVLGTSDYVTDVRVAGMLHARMIRPALAASTLQSVDSSLVRNARVIRQGDFLAVVAEREWDAVEALRTLRVNWTPPAKAPFPGTDGLHDYIRNAPVVKREDALKRGDPVSAFKSAARIVQAEYLWPLQSHTSMGPACAVADVRDGHATVWTGSQKPHSTREGVARLLGLPVQSVRAIWVQGPGSYGRNDAGDAALDAAYLSKLTGRPVRVQGMRSDGTAWDPKGAACVHRARAGLDAAGRVIAYEFISKGLSRVNVMYNESDPRDSLTGMALGLPVHPGAGLGTPSESYAFGAKLLAWEVVPPLLERYSPLRTGHLRDPLGAEVHFGSEQFIDEIAAAVGADPVEFRLQYVSAPRDAAVIKAAAEQAGWMPHKQPTHAIRPRHGTFRPSARASGAGASDTRTGHAAAGGRAAEVLRGRGVSYAQRSDTVVAVIAEIEVYPREGRIWARKFTVAHDCGLVINPKSLRQTIEGNVVQSLSRTLFEEVQFDRSRVTSVDWATYPILDMGHAPESIDIVLIESKEVAPSGAGEPTVRCVPAAVANAFWDATGVRIRRAPLTPARVRAALARS